MRDSRLAGGLAVLAVLLILVAAPAALALPLPVVWSSAYVTSANDGFTAVTTGPGAAVYAAGFAKAKGSGRDGRLLLVKYVAASPALTQEWVRTFTAPGANGAAATKIAVDSAGDVIVAGTLGVPSLTGKGSDIVVLKYSAAGALLWKTRYDGPAHRDDYVNGLAVDAHDNVFVAGASVGLGTGRDYVTIKVRKSGARAWVRRYAGPEVFDEARGVAVDTDGNAYVTGWSNDKSRTRHARTICYGPAGARRWIVTVNKARSWSGAAAVAFCSVPGARGVIISGYQGDRGTGNEDLMFAKYRGADGKVIWKRTMPNGATTEPHAAAIDGTGAPIAVGMTSPAGGIQAYIAGLSASGGDAWHSAFSSAVSDGEAEFDAIAVSAGGSLLAGGWTQTAPWSADDPMATAFAVRYSPAWPVTAPLDYVGPGGSSSRGKCTAVALAPSDSYAVGQETGAAGDLDAVLVEF